MKLSIHIFLCLLLIPTCTIGQVQNNGNLRMHNGSSVGFFGDFTNNGNFNNNLGTVFIAGSNPQTFNGSNSIQVNDIEINKTSNSLQLDNILQIAGTLTFTKGFIQTDRADIAVEFVEFLDNASSSGESDSSHIDGVIRKTGNDQFDFPTGNNSFLRPISISASSLVTDHFTAYYIEEDPDGLFSRSSLDTGVHHVSACEYWMLNRTAGSSDVAVNLSWASNSCGVDSLCELRISNWDGAQWVSAGNGGVSGTTSSGSLVSGGGCSVPGMLSSFGPFTLASNSVFNPLPINLISFDAEVCESSVCLAWQTATEINNDFFTVERSNNGIAWEGVVDKKGDGNSESILTYHAIDNSPYSGLSYYRLKQSDFNGDFVYSPIEAVYLEKPKDPELMVYPNPAGDVLSIKGMSSELNDFKINNMMGQDVRPLVSVLLNNENQLQLDVSLLKPGLYHINTGSERCKVIKK